FGAPSPAVIQSPVEPQDVVNLLSAAASHHEDPNRRILRDAGFDPFKPSIEPSKAHAVVMFECFRTEAHVAGEILVCAYAMDPRAHYEPLRGALETAQRDEVFDRGTRVGVVPRSEIDGRDVGVLVVILAYRVAALMPVLVVDRMRL